jgi:dTDP-4-dehydrorhamnose reductase
MNLQSLELWGGIECTVNRVGDRYHDQCQFSGHATRDSDLVALGSLGLKALRYPVLWEHAAAQSPAEVQLDWAHERLALIRELGIEPIAGLLHHGSGPSYTSLLDDAFPEKLASYAAAVSRRFPWLECYTPVNEPLTTARFSGLYGHWYPHERSDRAFVRALLNQAWGTVLSMRAVRAVNPAAKLVQTEDLGFVRSTPDLAYQADFENERRFLGLDLLYGRVDRNHPLYGYLRSSGASQAELELFREHSTPPDLLGFNYYVTGERFLDSRIEQYCAHVIGGNGRRRYADVEAVRVCRRGLLGPAVLLGGAFERYHTPLAITEAHLAGPAEEQARWFSYLWHEAETAKSAGVPVRAVTAWALLGSYGWDRLVTDGGSSYEAGAFQVLDGQLLETPYAGFLRAVSQGAPRVVDGGWWRSTERLLYEEDALAAGMGLAGGLVDERCDISQG